MYYSVLRTGKIFLLLLDLSMISKWRKVLRKNGHKSHARKLKALLLYSGPSKDQFLENRNTIIEKM